MTVRKMPGEFVPDMVRIGIDDCRSGLQHYYSVGGNENAFAEFKGHVVDISPNRGYLFVRLYLKFTDYDWRYGDDVVETYEDHVWVYDDQPFKDAGIEVGDNVQFSALVYAYHRKDGTEDYSLKAPQDIKKIESYELPKENKGLSNSFFASLVCETCMYADQCYGEPCIAPEGYKENRILQHKIQYHLDSVLEEMMRLRIAPEDTKKFRSLTQERFDDGLMDAELYSIFMKGLDDIEAKAEVFADDLDSYGPVDGSGDPQGW